MFTKPFVLLCLAAFLAYGTQGVMTPIIALYVQDMGGSAFLAGLALLAFSVPSFTVRPVVGHIADKWSALGVLGVGLILLTVGAVMFLAPVLIMLFAGNFVRGLGWAAVNTGAYTTLATTAPEARRGEAAGYYTSVTASATIFFPALALWLVDGLRGFQLVFLMSALLAAVGLPVVFYLAKSEGQPKLAPRNANPDTSGLIDRGVLMATGLNLCSTLAMPSVMAFLPYYARSLNIENIGLFYILAGLTSIVIRPILGKKSDAMGRGPAIGMGFSAQLVGFLLICIAQNLAVILLGGFFVALGAAMVGATTTALAMDLANPGSRGRAMATFSVSFQIGFGAGAIVSGAIADLFGLGAMYVGSIVMVVMGLILLISTRRSIPLPIK